MVTSLFVFERQKHWGAGPASNRAPTPMAATFERAKSIVGLLEGLYREIFFHHNIVLAAVAVALAVLAEYCWFTKDLARHEDLARGAGETDLGPSHSVCCRGAWALIPITRARGWGCFAVQLPAPLSYEA